MKIASIEEYLALLRTLSFSDVEFKWIDLLSIDSFTKLKMLMLAKIL